MIKPQRCDTDMSPEPDATVDSISNFEFEFEWLVFAEDWGRHPSSTQHIFRCLVANSETVYWVNSIGLRRPRISDAKRIFEKLKQVIKPTSNEFNQETVKTASITPDEVIAPIALSWPGSELVNALNRNLLTNQVSKKLEKYRNDETKYRVLWLSLPTARCIVDAFEQDIVVYYAGDDFSALAGVDHDEVSQEESQLVKNADLVLAASAKIAAKFPAHKTHVINHGVDKSLFSQQCSKPVNFPDGKFTVGYYGSITEWLDYDLIAYLAQQRRDINFVFIGHASCERCESIFKLANVYHFADMPHQQLIEYASNWQASLMPFQLNEQILACDPLKLREYLAIGKPILSSTFPALTPFDDVVFHGKDKIEILSRLDSIINLDPQQQQVLMANSRAHIQQASWEQRAEQVKALIADVIAAKKTAGGCKYAKR